MSSRTSLHRSLAFLTVLALVLAACAPATAPSGGPDTGAAEKIPVSMWVGADDTADCVISVAVDTWNAQSDTIEVTASKKADMINAVRPALAGGGGPDIVQTHGPAFIAELVKAGQVIPMDDFVDDFGWEELFVPWALELGRLDGKLYSLPLELETIVLFYNKTLFEENGWEPPTTMDDLQALAKQIQDAGIIPFAGQAGECQACNEWYFTEFVNKIAGPDMVHQGLRNEIPWDHPDFVQSITTLNDMMQAGYWMGDTSRFLATTFPEFMSAFANGEAAMNMEGTWFYGREGQYFGEEFDHGNEWDWVAFPSASGEEIFSIGLGGTMSINKNAENPAAAAEFLTYYFSPEIQSNLFTECRLAVGPIRVEASQMEDVDPRMLAIFETMEQASDTGNYGYTTWTFFPPKSVVYIYDEIEKVWIGETTPEQYLKGLAETFQEEFDAGEALAIPDR